jgi:DNA-binding CsgD family transcriptional regulator
MQAPPLALDRAAESSDQREAYRMPAARLRAANDVGAAIAHQLNEPLTALLLYLHEIKDKSEETRGTDPAANSMRQMVDSALRETERVCAIIERMGHPFEAPDDVEPAVALGREAIEAWMRNSNGPFGLPRSRRSSLTARELEVLDLIVDGLPNKVGGHRLGISKRTFEVHRAHIMKKLGAKNTADLVRMALNKTP